MTTQASFYGRCLVDAYERAFGLDNLTVEPIFNGGWMGSIERMNGYATDEDVKAAIKAELEIRKEGFITVRG